jgi:hypothetical protein
VAQHISNERKTNKQTNKKRKHKFQRTMKQKTNKQTNKEEKSKRAQKLYTEENIENVSR